MGERRRGLPTTPSSLSGMSANPFLEEWKRVSPAICYLVLDVEVVLLAELVPVCLLALWQNQDDVELWVVLDESARWCASG